MFAAEIHPYLDEYFKTLDNTKTKAIIEYSVKGGKCIRGFIVKHILECFMGENNIPWEPIVIVELIHAASLIIDDLPCMDNDKLRRGKASTFVKFGKHESILFSFYIISESLRLLSQGFKESDNGQCKFHSITEKWCELLGKNLVLGQLMDLQCDATEFFDIPKKKDLNESIIEYKTCSLFSFTFILGAMFSNKTVNIDDFKKMGYSFGMMFQLVDDYKDKNEDNVFKNYILKHGMEKSIIRYLQEKVCFINLLNKYNLFTKEFKLIIETLDNKFNFNNSLLATNT